MARPVSDITATGTHRHRLFAVLAITVSVMAVEVIGGQTAESWWLSPRY
jgi:Co/Zn/Cd efflux system component